MHFGNANLSGANVEGAFLSGTVLANVDLSSFCKANLRHASPSLVDAGAIAKSLHAVRLKEFLRDSGMPEVFIEYMVDCARTLSPGEIFSLFQSTFISYGAPDEAFASKLNEALRKQGVKTFFFKDHAKPGEKLHRMMRNGVNEHERTILICSQNSLGRVGVLNEVEEILDREARDGGRAYLLPVRLDDYVFNGWCPENPDVAQTVRGRVIADFRDNHDPVRFDAELAKLVAALKKPAP